MDVIPWEMTMAGSFLGSMVGMVMGFGFFGGRWGAMALVVGFMGGLWIQEERLKQIMVRKFNVYEAEAKAKHADWKAKEAESKAWVVEMETKAKVVEAEAAQAEMMALAETLRWYVKRDEWDAKINDAEAEAEVEVEEREPEDIQYEFKFGDGGFGKASPKNGWTFNKNEWIKKPEEFFFKHKSTPTPTPPL